jgi:hypothetical protein
VPITAVMDASVTCRANGGHESRVIGTSVGKAVHMMRLEMDVHRGVRAEGVTLVLGFHNTEVGVPGRIAPVITAPSLQFSDQVRLSAA